MKYIFFRSIYTCFLFLSANAVLFAQNDPYPEGLHIYPYLQYATPTSIIIKWETVKPTKGTVSYSEDDRFNIVQRERKAVKIHEIKLDGLKPDTRYRYRVSYNNTILEAASFTTAPVPGTPNWRMVAYGDNRTYPETHKRIVTQILDLNPSMIIHSGDLVAHGGNYEQWKEQYFDPMKGLSENIAVFPSLGNHEWNSPYYYEYMSLPDENDESYYSFDYGNAHFIALNSNQREEPFDMNSKQTKWLIKDLKKNADAKWKIVYFHHPLFRCHPTRGIEAQRWVWQDVFEKYGVDLVINGHDHYYQRTYAIGNYQGKPSRGIYHIISGGGGAPNYPVVPKTHAAYRRSVHHITVMDFQGDRIVGRAIDDQGNIFDAFVYDKEAENSPEEFISYEVFKIERDLTNAIYDLPKETFDSAVDIKGSLEINNPFSHPLQMSFSWETTRNWNTNEAKKEIIEPGQPIKITYTASTSAETIHPFPSARLHFQTPDGKMAFKNNTIEFFPLKIEKKRQVRPLVVNSPPLIDGDLADWKWEKNLVLDHFSEIHGNVPIQKTELILSTNGSKNTLFIAGKVEASKKFSNSGTTKPGDVTILQDDNIKILIGVGKEVFTYVVNPKGTLLDAKDKSFLWNSSATAAARSYKNGWQFEMKIPLDELKIKKQKTTINFLRKDDENNTNYEYALTFGRSRLDHRIPMYKPDWEAVDRFAELILK